MLKKNHTASIIVKEKFSMFETFQFLKRIKLFHDILLP